jgi:hypothetical protein
MGGPYPQAGANAIPLPRSKPLRARVKGRREKPSSARANRSAVSRVGVLAVSRGLAGLDCAGFA